MKKSTSTEDASRGQCSDQGQQRLRPRSPPRGRGLAHSPRFSAPRPPRRGGQGFLPRESPRSPPGRPARPAGAAPALRGRAFPAAAPGPGAAKRLGVGQRPPGRLRDGRRRRDALDAPRTLRSPGAARYGPAAVTGAPAPPPGPGRTCPGLACHRLGLAPRPRAPQRPPAPSTPVTRL